MSEELETALLAGGLFVGGIIALIVSIVVRKRTRRLLDIGLDANGTIVDLRREAAGEGVGWFPVVEFEAHDGTRYAFTSDVGVLPLFRRKGQRVRVVYDPAMPMDAMIRSRMWMEIAPAVSIYAAIAMIIAGVAVFADALLQRAG